MAIVRYNGASHSLTLRDRIVSLLRPQLKSSPLPLPIAVQYMSVAAYWSDARPSSYIRDGYKRNSAVFAVSRALANGFAEAPLMVYTDETKKKPLPNHPLRTLIKRPNEYMGEDEFWKSFIIYAANAGDGFGYMVMNNGGQPGEIWPYHAGVMWPVPSRDQWVDHYVYSTDNGLHKELIPTPSVVHFKWAIDPEYPYRGLPALASVWREVDVDSSLIGQIKILLQNNTVPPGVLTFPPDANPTPDQMRELKQDWRKKAGGNNLGDIPVMSMGVEFKRTSLTYQEMQLEALHAIPEARIAAAYGVPAIVAGLNIGLNKATYSNFEEARKMFTEQTLVPLWAAVASEFQQAVVPFFGNDVYVDFDLSRVRALQEGQDAKSARILTSFKSGTATLNEYRTQGLGWDKVEGGDVWALPKGDNGFSLIDNLADYTDQSAQLAQQAIEQGQHQTEGLALQNEAAQAQLQQTAQPVGAPTDQSQGMPDNVILLPQGGKALPVGTKDGPKKGPGSRGGRFYIDEHGKVRYGTPPAKKPQAAKTPPQDKARAAAVKQAKTNANQELRDAGGDLVALQKSGWENAGEGDSGYKDVASANQWAIDQAKQHPDQMVAVVAASDGSYQVVAKPIAKLGGDRSNAVTRSAADEARSQRQQARQAESTRAQGVQRDVRAQREARQQARESRLAQRERDQAARQAAGPKPRTRKVPAGSRSGRGT